MNNKNHKPIIRHTDVRALTST